MVESKRKLSWQERLLAGLAFACVIIIIMFFAVTLIIRNADKRAEEQAAAALLLNPGFEDGFRSVNGVGELGVGKGWFPWFLEAPGVHRPEYKEETRSTGEGRVYLGDSAQKQFTTFSAQDGGIRQSVKAIPGEWYEFSAWVYVWSSSCDNPDTSYVPGQCSHGGCSAMVGINPWGSWDALHRTTVWGKEKREAYNQWVKVTVTAQAWSEEITLFTRTQCEWPIKHNDSYWDAAEFGLVEWGDCPACPTPEPCPTLVPCNDNATLEQFRDIIQEELRAVRWGVVE